MTKIPVDLEDHPSPSGTRPLAAHQQHSYIASRYVWIHHSRLWRPPTDVYETEDSIRIQVEVAGMEKADFAVVLEGRELRVSGIRPDHSERRVYHQLEIHTGEFLTQVDLPCEVSQKNIHAHYRDGFLTVELPKECPSPE
jgi:HSP20 family molecular chaperone IbpA